MSKARPSPSVPASSPMLRKRSRRGAPKRKAIRLENAATPYLLERGSQLVMDGREVAPNATGVYDRLYGAANG